MKISKTDVLSFDDWYKEAKKLNDDGFSAKDFFEAGQQSKQDEVCKLQSEIDELMVGNHHLSVMTAEAESYSDYWKHERDKLQKRIDDALKWCEKGCILKAMEILKGEQDK